MQCQTIQQMLNKLAELYDLERTLIIFEKVTIVGFLSTAPKLLKLKRKK
jgi:hypothetical protein